jgi:hypothetical protein
MSAELESLVKMLFQALREWWASLGAFAWFFLGILLVGGVLLSVVLLRWVWRGGLSRQTPLGPSADRAVAGRSVRRDN